MGYGLGSCDDGTWDMKTGNRQHVKIEVRA